MSEEREALEKICKLVREKQAKYSASIALVNAFHELAFRTIRELEVKKEIVLP